MILCSTRLCRHLVEIRSQVRPFPDAVVWLVRLDPIERRVRMLFSRYLGKHSPRIMSFNSLPDTSVSLMAFVISFLDMSPRRPALLICSGIPNPAGLVITQLSVRVEVNASLSCVPWSNRTSLGQPAQRGQSQTKACRLVWIDGELRSDVLSTIHEQPSIFACVLV